MAPSLAKSAKGHFFFDHLPASFDINARYEVRTIDGDGNRSSVVAAEAIAGDPETHQPLGEFEATQSAHGWSYEQTSDAQNYEELTWQNGGYEGYWAGSGLGRIGRIWAQPSASAEIITEIYGFEDVLRKPVRANSKRSQRRFRLTRRSQNRTQWKADLAGVRMGRCSPLRYAGGLCGEGPGCS